jgi:hypothetical protein
MKNIQGNIWMLFGIINGQYLRHMDNILALYMRYMEQ